MATVKSATAEKVTAAMAVEKVATVKSDVKNVAVEKTATEKVKTIVVEQADRNVSSESAQTDGTDNAMLSFDNVDKNQDCSEFEGLTAAEVQQEDECVVPSMKVDSFTFQWVTWRREVDRPLGVSIDFDDKNNLVQMVDVFEDSLAGERNPRIRAIRKLCDQDLRPGGIIEIVNETANHVEIQRELRTSLNIHLKIVRKE